MLTAPAEELQQIFDLPEEEIDLVRAAGSLARLEYPRLNLDPYVDRLERFAQIIAGRIAPGAAPEEAVEEVNRYLFDQLGFHGNRHDYYDPRNSFLNEVMDRRTGIPITLSVVYIEVARRLALPIYGVGLPSHFVLKYDDRVRVFFIDPFHGGRILDRASCRETVEEIQGREVELLDTHFAAVGKREIVLRICNNLRAIYLAARQHRKALAVVEAALALAPDSPEELKQRAWLHHELGKRAEAVRDLEAYLAAVPCAEDRDRVRRWIEAIRKNQAVLN